VLALRKGDRQAAAHTLGLMSSCGAVLELFLNPVFGRLSDSHGRKPFLLMAPLVRAVLHSLVGLVPGSLPLQFLDRIVTAAMVFTFQAPIQASLTDLFHGTGCTEQLSVALARNQTFFGLGCALGPLIGARLAGVKAFLASGALFAASALYIQASCPETLADEHKIDFDVLACSPLRFLKLFRSRDTAMLATTIGLQSFGDSVNITDVSFLYMNTVMKWGQQEMGNYMTAVGVSNIVGAETMREMIKSRGQEVSAKVANLGMTLAMGLLGTARSVPQIALALAAMTFGQLRATPVSAYLQTYGRQINMGRSEIISAQMNITALCKVAAPLLYTSLFEWGVGRRLPGLPYLLCCLLTVAAQGCLSSIKLPAAAP